MSAKVDKDIALILTDMLAFQLLSKTAIAAKLPEPIVTYGSLSVDP